MEIKVTEAELLAMKSIMQFRNLHDPCDCDECRAKRPFCYGCKEKSDFDKKVDERIKPYEQLFACAPVVSYLHALMSYEEAEGAYLAAGRELDAAEQLKNELKKALTIVEEDA